MSVPEGRLHRFVIRFCGSTYNTVNHLNVILYPNPFSLLYFIFPSTIFPGHKDKTAWEPLFHSVFWFFCPLLLYCASGPETFWDPLFLGTGFHERIFRKGKIFVSGGAISAKSRPGPCRNRALPETCGLLNKTRILSPPL